MLPRDLDPTRNIAETLAAMNKRLRKIEAMPFPLADAAALLLTSVAPQSIPDSVWTYVDFDFTSGGTWELGLTIENGHVPLGDNIDKVRTALVPPEEAVFLFTMEVGWAVNAAGYRQLRWLANDGSAATYDHPIVPAVGACNRSEVHFRRQITAAAYYTIQVWQNSGAPLNLTFMDFGVWRIR